MGRRRRQLGCRCGRLALPLLCALASVSAAQDALPPTTLPVEDEPLREIPEHVLSKLSEIEDFSLRIDFPGYYDLLEFVRHSEFDPGDHQQATEITDWQTLLDRPSEFRGEPITIEGVVGRHRSYQYRDAQRRKRFGTVWELDLHHPQRGYPITATIFLTANADEIGIDSTIRVTGYFVMVQQYPRSGKPLGQKIVLIAKGPSMVARAAPPTPPARRERRWIWGAAAVAAAMLVVWIIVRGSAKGERSDLQALTATHRAPLNLSDELDEWADGDDSLKP